MDWSGGKVFNGTLNSEENDLELIELYIQYK